MKFSVYKKGRKVGEGNIGSLSNKKQRGRVDRLGFTLGRAVSTARESYGTAKRAYNEGQRRYASLERKGRRVARVAGNIEKAMDMSFGGVLGKMGQKPQHQHPRRSKTVIHSGGQTIVIYGNGGRQKKRKQTDVLRSL